MYQSIIPFIPKKYHKMSKFERDRYSNYRSLVFPFSPQSLRNSKIFLEVISSYESRFILRFLKIISSRLKHRCIKVSFHLSSRKWYQNSKLEAILLYESRYNFEKSSVRDENIDASKYHSIYPQETSQDIKIRTKWNTSCHDF